MFIVVLTAFLAFATATAAKCPDGAMQGSKPYDCYLFQTEPATFFNAAIDECAALGGELTSIGSAFESIVVNSGVHWSGEYWIGLAFDSDEDAWYWWDEAPVNYTHWAQGNREVILWCGTGLALFTKYQEQEFGLIATGVKF